MNTKRLALATMLWLGASASMAQTVTDPVAQVRALSSAGVDANLAAMAQQVTLTAPIRTDDVTTIERAVYLPQYKTFNYVVRLSQSIPSQTLASNTVAAICRGRTNVAFMDRGVTYQYSVTTPSETFAISIKRADCR